MITLSLPEYSTAYFSLRLADWTTRTVRNFSPWEGLKGTVGFATNQHGSEDWRKIMCADGEVRPKSCRWYLHGGVFKTGFTVQWIIDAKSLYGCGPHSVKILLGKLPKPQMMLFCLTSGSGSASWTQPLGRKSIREILLRCDGVEVMSELGFLYGREVWWI